MIRHVAGALAPPEGVYDADVVILALDRADETLAAIGSALAQTGVRLHVTVLDQGSDPGALARLAALVDGRTDVTLLASDCNLGVAEGRNQASAFGHGRIIAGLDNDAEFATTDTLLRMVLVLDRGPLLAAIGCRIVTHTTGEDDLSSWGYPPALLDLAGKRFLAVTFVGAGHAIRRAAWEAVGGYDPALFFCWEEYDFSARAIALGWRVQYRGECVIRHKVAAERRVSWSGQRWFYFVRNRLYIGRKQGVRWWALLPRAMGYGLKGVVNGLPGQTMVAIAAAMRLPVTSCPLPLEALTYLRCHDRAYRGSWLNRLRREILNRL